MIKKILIAIAACLGLALLVECRHHYEGPLTPKLDTRTGKWGFADTLGKMVISPAWDRANGFSEGLAVVGQNDGQFGYIDRAGKIVVPLKYKSAADFREGLAAVSFNNRYGFIDTTGVETISLKYDEVSDFQDSIALVRFNHLFGFIDKAGYEVIPTQYERAGVFSGGWALVKLAGKWGGIDKSGNEIVPFKYDSISAFKEGMALVQTDGKYGYIDTSGNERIPVQYDEATSFKDGFAQVSATEGKGKIDKTGQFTLLSRKIPLKEAVEKGYVKFSASGGGIESSYIRIENQTDTELDLFIPAGTFLSANSSSFQSMVLTSPQNIVVSARDTYSSSVPTACMNISRDIPGGDDSFSIAQRPENHLLTKVIKIINEGNYPYKVIQAAVWIVTDGADYNDMGTLIDQYYNRIIDEEDYQRALSIVKEARKRE